MCAAGQDVPGLDLFPSSLILARPSPQASSRRPRFGICKPSWTLLVKSEDVRPWDVLVLEIEEVHRPGTSDTLTSLETGLDIRNQGCWKDG